MQAEIDRVYQEHLATLAKRSVTRQRKTIDYFHGGFFLRGSPALCETNSATRRSIGGFAADALEHRLGPLPGLGRRSASPPCLPPTLSPARSVHIAALPNRAGLRSSSCKLRRAAPHIALESADARLRSGEAGFLECLNRAVSDRETNVRLDVLSMAFTGLMLAYATCFLTSGSAPTSAVDRNAAGDPIASVDGGTVGWSITTIVGGAIGWPIVAAAITIPRIAVAGVVVGRIAVAITRVALGTVAIARTRRAVSGSNPWP